MGSVALSGTEIAGADNVVPLARKTHANQYWGLPNILGSDPRGFPKALTSAQTSGYVKETATSRRLAGLHLPGVHVKRANMPTIDKLRLTKSDKDWKLITQATATRAIFGKLPKKALEEIAVVVTVRDTAATTNPSRQPVLHRKVVWRTLDKSKKKLRATVEFDFPKKIDKKLSRMNSARRGKAITVHVVHVIDADGRKVAGRRTADHLKTAALDLATARARTSSDGLGALVNIYNNDQTLNSSGGDALSMAVNLVGNPVSCMLTNGSSASDFAALNVTGLQPFATTEGFIEAAAGGQQPTNEASAASDVVDAMEEDYIEAVIETLLKLPLSWTTVAFDAFEELIELWLTGCTYAPGMYTLAATDALGNASTIGYALNYKFNDSPDSSSTLGGIADAASAYNIYSADDDLGFASNANYLNSAFLQQNYAPGPENSTFVLAPPNANSTVTSAIMGSGGDSGLSFAGSPASTIWPLASTGGSKDQQYPVLDFSLNWGSACSSQIGGVFGQLGNSGGVVPNYVYNPCAGWPNAPTAISGAVPNAPTLTSVSTGASQITVNWTASPTTNPPAMPATSYMAQAVAPDGTTATCPATTDLTCTITGLNGGQTFAVYVWGSNANGNSALSNSAPAALPVAVPGAPDVTSGTSGNTELTVTWSPPAVNGGSPITSYTATAMLGGPVAGYPAGTCTTSALTCTITGLTNGTRYLVAVAATNAVGTGPQGTGWYGSPGNTAPGAPQLTGATPGSTTIVAAWVPPANDGGTRITGYTATATTPAGLVVASCQPPTSSDYESDDNMCLLAGLEPLATYGVTVTATNAMGTGAASNSMAATLSTTPDPVTGLSASPGPPGKDGPTIVGRWDASSPGQTSGLPPLNYTMVATNAGTGQTTSCTVPGGAEPTCQLDGFANVMNLLYVTVTTAAGTSAPVPVIDYLL